MGALLEATVELANRGGLVVRLAAGGTAFLPASQIDPARLPTTTGGPPEALAALVGLRLRCEVLDNKPGALVVSEKAACATAFRQGLAVGAAVPVRVKSVTDYGAFCELLTPAGLPSGVEALLHVSEVSWSPVRHCGDVLAAGQAVQVAVLAVDAAAGRVSVSLRALAADPLLETLDTVLPRGGEEAAAGAEGAPFSDLLPGLALICTDLRAVPGVAGVTLGRQAREQRVVSQDLELWLTTDPVEDGFNLVARAGRTVQEVHLATRLSRDEVKAVVQRVTAKAARVKA